MRKKNFIIVILTFLILNCAFSQGNNISKLRAKELTLKSANGVQGPSLVDFLVAFDRNLNRISLFRETTESYDVVKTKAHATNKRGEYTLYLCKDKDLEDYEIIEFIPDTQDRVIFSIQKIGSNVTTIITCAFLE